MDALCQEYKQLIQTKLGDVFWHLKQLCLSVAKPNDVEGNYVSTPDMFPKQVNLYNFARTASQVVEIGFNAGHSAAIMLAANPQLRIVAFDLGTHPYVKICYEYLNKVFHNRITLIIGDSKHTIAEFIRHTPHQRFDLLHIDGGHDTFTALSDILMMRLLATNDNVVIADDDDLENLYNLHREVSTLGIWKPIVSDIVVPMPNHARHYIAHFSSQHKDNLL